MGINWLILIILLTILVICICVFIKCITLTKRINELEEKIKAIKCRIDDVEWWINVTNKHTRDTYELLCEMKDENENN